MTEFEVKCVKMAFMNTVQIVKKRKAQHDKERKRRYKDDPNPKATDKRYNFLYEKHTRLD